MYTSRGLDEIALEAAPAALGTPAGGRRRSAR